MKLFNVTAQVYQNSDLSKQNLLINEVHDGSSSDEALVNFPGVTGTSEWNEPQRHKGHKDRSLPY